MSVSKYIILVPYDTTDLSVKALHKARDIASTINSIIIVLHVFEDTNLSLEKNKIFVSNVNDRRKQDFCFKKSFKKEAEAEAEILIKREVEQLRQNGLSSKYIIQFGSPADEIINVSKKENASLIIMGSNGSLKRLNNRKGIGNISRWISEVAVCPVVLIR